MLTCTADRHKHARLAAAVDELTRYLRRNTQQLAVAQILLFVLKRGAISVGQIATALSSVVPSAWEELPGADAEQLRGLLAPTRPGNRSPRAGDAVLLSRATSCGQHRISATVRTIVGPRRRYPLVRASRSS
jgi:hypothetical protein